MDIQVVTVSLVPGDVVELKSGGPLMTIMWISESSTKPSRPVKCSWFLEGKHYEGEFSYASLKKKPQ